MRFTMTDNLTPPPAGNDTALTAARRLGMPDDFWEAYRDALRSRKSVTPAEALAWYDDDR